MRVTLVQLGETKSAEIAALCRSFESRLSAAWQVERRVLKPAPLSAEAGEKEIARALEKEADELLALLGAKPRACKTALAVEGREVSSEEFAALLSGRMQEVSEFVFLIGSSHGLSERVKAACDVRLSLSRMTLPHELCRLLFTEQLYRAYTILHRMKYHK